MKLLRTLAVAALSMAMVALPGCILTSAQILAHFSLPNPFTINSATSPSELIPVDLAAEVSEYADNKDKLKGLTDLAILGTFTNVAGPAGGVEVYITPTLDFPPGGTPTIPSNAVLLWGPGTIGAAPATRTIGWDESAALFNKAGKDLLIAEILGDGQFTLYTTGSAGVYDIRVDDGLLVLVLDTGQ